MSDNQIRNQISEVLTTFAEREEWDPQLWSTFEDLKKKTSIDALLAQADEELIHYSGCFNSRNLLGQKVPPNPSEMKDIRATLRRIASALQQP